MGRRMGNEPISGPEFEVKDILSTDKWVDSYIENPEAIETNNNHVRQYTAESSHNGGTKSTTKLLEKMLKSTSSSAENSHSQQQRGKSSSIGGRDSRTVKQIDSLFQTTQRPPTPKVNFTTYSYENFELVFLQAILRGRCEQLHLKEQV